MVFVHGFCLDMGTFHFQRQALPGTPGVRMVFYDQPGHGRSGRLEKGEYTIELLGAALRRCSTETVPDRPGRPGRPLDGRHGHHGAGRRGARAVQARRPGRRRGADLHLGRRARRGHLRPARGAGPVPQAVAAAHQRRRLGHRRHARPGPGGLHRPGLAAHPQVRVRLGPGQPGPGLLCGADELGHPDRVGGPLPARALHPRPGAGAGRAGQGAGAGHLSATRTCSPRSSTRRRSCAALPDAELVVVPNAGHVVLLEHSEAVNAVLLPFLRKLLP